MIIPLPDLVAYISLLLCGIFLTICIILVTRTEQYPIIKRSKNEEFYIDQKSGEKLQFPTIDDKFSLNLSVIIPAYNEENRLSPMLDECIKFLENRAKENPDFKYEIIVVSDGSQDDTVHIANQYSNKLGSEKLRVLDLETNRGKGGAVRLGMLSARGAMLLFADADGATKFADLANLENSLSILLNSDYIKNPGEVSEKLAISIGSRAHLQEEAIASRSLFRTVLMHGFHFLVWYFAVKNVKDTQCGFKLFTRKAAKICFESVHLESWAFDVELLYIAETLNIPVTEISVNWTEIDGSKLTPVWSWIQMGKDLVLIQLRYTFCVWSIKSQQ